MIVLISMISFFLDGILSRYILPNSLFLPLFTIVSLVIIYPYFNNDNLLPLSTDERAKNNWIVI